MPQFPGQRESERVERAIPGMPRSSEGCGESQLINMETQNGREESQILGLLLGFHVSLQVTEKTGLPLLLALHWSGNSLHLAALCLQADLRQCAGAWTSVFWSIVCAVIGRALNLISDPLVDIISLGIHVYPPVLKWLPTFCFWRCSTSVFWHLDQLELIAFGRELLGEIWGNCHWLTDAFCPV